MFSKHARFGTRRHLPPGIKKALKDHKAYWEQQTLLIDERRAAHREEDARIEWLTFITE